MAEDDSASDDQSKKCPDQSGLESKLSKVDKRIKNGKWINYRKKKIEEKEKTRICNYCHGEFKGQSNKIFCSRKCVRMNYLDKHPEMAKKSANYRRFFREQYGIFKKRNMGPK